MPGPAWTYRGTVATGLIGAVLVALGGTVIGRSLPGDWVHHLPWVSSGALGRTPAYVLVFAGLGLMTGAWLALRRTADSPQGVARSVRAAFVWSAPFALLPPLFSDDGWSYAAGATLSRLGFSPYVFSPGALDAAPGVNGRWMWTTSPYGPFAVGWGATWAHVSLNPWVVMLSYRLLGYLALGVLAYAVPRLARYAGAPAGVATWAAVANPFVLVHGIAGMHLDLAMVALMLLGLERATRGRWLTATVVLGCAAAMKWPALMAVPGVVLLGAVAATVRARVRRAGAVLAVALGTLALTGLVPGTGEGWLSGLHATFGIRSRLSAMHDVTSVVSPVLGDGAGPVVQVLGVLTVLGLAAYAVLRGGRTPADRLRWTALVTLGIVLVSPVVHYWYFLWCLPLLACLRRGPVADRTLVAVLAVLSLVAPFDPSRHLPGTFLVPFAIAAAAIGPTAWAVAQAALARAGATPRSSGGNLTRT